MSWGWAEAQFLYTFLQGASDIETRVRAFQPPRHKPTHILDTIPIFGMFLITLEQRFPCFGIHRNARSAQQ